MKWTRNARMSSVLGTFLTLGVFASAAAADWPMWRGDAARRGNSDEQLPEKLHLQWVLELPPPDPAWPSNQVKLQFDRLYEPVLMGKSLFVPSMINDSLTAYHTDTGERQWRFYADGPIRFAPACWNGRVYVVSDDGHLYCLDAENGQVVWKFRGGPTDHRVLGNDRLVSAWPARGAPVIYDGTVYFGAGIWPFMGVFLYALDAETGSIVWSNSGTGSMWLTQQHNSPAFAGVAPQGYLAATKDHLAVAGGRTVPAVFDRHTGEFKFFNVSERPTGYKGGGGFDVVVGENFYLNRGLMFRLDNGSFVQKVDSLILTDHAIIGKNDKGIVAYRPRWEEIETKDKKGKTVKKRVCKEMFSTPLDDKIVRAFIKCGTRLYCKGEKSKIMAVELPRFDQAAGVSWSTTLPDEPLNMIAGDGKLFVSTDLGNIYCFGGKESDVEAPKVDRKTKNAAAAPRLEFPRDRWTAVAGAILRRTQRTEGYCLALGLGTGRLVEELAHQSDLHIMVVEKDPELADRFRRRLDDRGAYGTRVALVVADPRAAGLSQYMADLVVAEDPEAAGVDEGGPFVERVFSVLRPYSGVACFTGPTALQRSFVRAAREADLDRGSVERRGGFALLRREGPPTGSADWTHQYGDASNSVVSRDRVVKAPLGILWFGGPSNEGVLPRHGHGPAPQVAGGRLFIEGRDQIRAVDVYTGRLLWEREIKDIGKHYDYTSHEPGANILGSNYVSLPDSVYVAQGDKCLRLDPETGETISKILLPISPVAILDGAEDPPEWGYLGIWKDILIAGTKPTEFVSPDFVAGDFSGLKDDPLKKSVQRIKDLIDFEEIPRKKNDDPKKDAEVSRAYVLANMNKLLREDDMVSKIPLKVRYRVDADKLEKELEDYLKEVPGRQASDYAAIVIKRKLLALYYKTAKYVEKPAGKYGSHLKIGSKRLVAMNRFTGKVLWEHEAKHKMRHNAIALGGGMAFYIDRLSEARANYRRRRGLPLDEDRSVTALDLHTGEVVWRTTERVFGTWLGYSDEHDILLQAGSKGRDRFRDEVGQGMVAYRGATGEIVWQNDAKYDGPCMLLGDRVITQVGSTAGFALDVRTGARLKRPHPISGEEIDWGYTRKYGCNAAIGSPNLLTFRSAAAGYYDLLQDHGTGNLGGFRTGCTSNLIAADGVLNAPDYTRTCECAYQNQASLAMVHMPEVEVWTFSPYGTPTESVEQAGINFGAPGDRRGPDGTYWVDYPSVGGESPDLSVKVLSDQAEYLRLHSSRVESSEINWIAASALEGEGKISVKVAVTEDVAVPNQVAGGASIKSADAASSNEVPAWTLPKSSVENLRSLQNVSGKKKLAAVISGDDDLALSSITVEFWARGKGDFDYVDARYVGKDKKNHGLVIDNRTLRVRYYVADEKGEKSEDVVTITDKDKTAENKWVHIAFTYDANTGVGTLYRDGKSVGTHDGPDGRSLWWDSTPEYRLLKDTEDRGTYLDELRIADHAVRPTQFMVTGEDQLAADHLAGYWRMDPTHGDDTKGQLYTVRLVFAEIDAAKPGERVFDVTLQGDKRLTDFDIAAVAGGPDRVVVREFEDVVIHDYLTVELSAKKDLPPILNGLQILASSPGN